MRRGRNLDESLNQNNLFYSGYRADELGDLARNTAESRSGLSRTITDILNQANNGVLTAERSAQEKELETLSCLAAEKLLTERTLGVASARRA